MPETLLSVGIDVGTTTCQLIFSRLEIQNTAGSFSVPNLKISGRKILYESPIHFTPLRSETEVNAPALRDLVAAEYQAAGISPADVQTGAIIITGETARKENAKAVLDALQDFAGDFVVTTAGPNLESVLAARGAGAEKYSERLSCPLLHMDIGGGTANLALLDGGKILSTGCLNVGGRLIKVDEQGKIVYLSPVLQGLTNLSLGQTAVEREVSSLCGVLAQALEEAASLRPRTALVDRLWTEGPMELPKKPLAFSFSGGVADLIDPEDSRGNPFRYGDMGPLLGKAIRKSRLCKGRYRLGTETIRATVIGAGCHATQLSGSTVYYRSLRFPLRNLPVSTLGLKEQELPPEELSPLLRQRIRLYSRTADPRPVALSLPGFSSPKFGDLCRLADGIADGLSEQLSQGFPAIVTLNRDMAKALGHALAFRLPESTPILCLDSLSLQDGDFLDVGAPVGSGAALPVVIKTLILPGAASM